MIKLAFYTDIHHSGTGPKRRMDNYPEAVARKHTFIYTDGIERGADLFVNAGDMNETSFVANSVIARQYEIMRSRQSVPEYGILGNHDVIGNNAEKMDQVSAGLLFASGAINKLSMTPTRFEKNGIVLAIYGLDIHKDMDNLRPEDYYVEKPDWCDFCILVAHGWQTETDKGMQDHGIKTTTFKAVLETGTQADVIYSGHFHPGYETMVKYKPDGSRLMFVNPGSPVRMKALKSEMARKVGYSITTFYPERHFFEENFYAFPEHIALPGEQVLNREALEEDIRKEELKVSIDAKYSDMSISSVSARDVIMEIARAENVPQDVKDDLAKRLDVIEERKEQEKLSYTT